jgi:methanogenic corrinoid protein MtbC1
MLMWCSYCQRFIRESPPFESLAITHGLCERCALTVNSLDDSDFTHILSLRDIQSQLYLAGKRNDLKAAEHAIEIAAKSNIKGVDILIGVLAPLLYQIGDDWQRGIVSVAEEHRFTAFVEEIFQLVAATMKPMAPANATLVEHTDVLLINAPGNNHTLAIRILALWLADKGMHTRVVDISLSLEDLVALVIRTQPRLLLISFALAEQRMSVVAIAKRIAELPKRIRPKVIVGGYAVKLNLAAAIPGVDFVADISKLLPESEGASQEGEKGDFF